MVSHNKKLSTQGLVLPQAMVEESIYRCGIGGLEPWGGWYHRKYCGFVSSNTDELLQLSWLFDAEEAKPRRITCEKN